VRLQWPATRVVSRPAYRDFTSLDLNDGLHVRFVVTPNHVQPHSCVLSVGSNFKDEGADNLFIGPRREPDAGSIHAGSRL
jgi:hypothetical protein